MHWIVPYDSIYEKHSQNMGETMQIESIAPIRYDSSATLIAGTGLNVQALRQFDHRLEQARQGVLSDLKAWLANESVPEHKRPLDAGFIDLPERLLREYRQNQTTSEVGRVVAAANRLSEEVERVVVLGIGGSYMGARALFEALRHPYYNELSREGRHGRPRIYFEGNNVDNYAVRGLMDVLNQSQEPWGIIVVSKSGGTLETAVAFRLFLRMLKESCGNDMKKVARRIIPVTGETGRLRDLSTALGCPDVFPIPDGVGGRFSILSAVGLMPAAVMGLDVVKLLEGAVAMNQRFREAKIGDNPVLDYSAVCHLMEASHGATIRILSTWGKRLEAVGLWYDQLLSESLGKQGQGATPITGVNTRDLHSRGQQHQEGRRDKLITNLIVDGPCDAPLEVGTSDFDQDKLNELADKTLPQILDAALRGTNKAYADDQRPTADLHLPRLDEASLGQLFQMFMLATVLEGQLLGINPYGQPGVEAYKKNMNAILRGKG